MLVISRRIGESFYIGEDIVATVVDISGEKVVLGIEAPRDIPITRLEIDQIREYNRTAGKFSDNINMKGFARLYKSKLSEQREKARLGGTPPEKSEK